MNVYTCSNFDGHWPVGVAAVVVARDEEQARRLLGKELLRRGLILSESAVLTRVSRRPHALILQDGNY